MSLHFTSLVRGWFLTPFSSQLHHPKLLELLEKMTLDDPGLAILKLKKYIGPDAITIVLDAILDVMMYNTTVQALYIQNFNVGLKDAQVRRGLARRLKRRNSVYTRVTRFVRR